MPKPGASNRPRYLKLADGLRRDIASGRYPVGSLLPTETELCRSFEVSRYTVREALRALAELGLVRRRQGSGTQVLARQASERYTQSLGSITDLLQYARDTYLELGHGETLSARGTLAELLDCAPGRQWRKYSGVRRTATSAQPICTTDVYLDPAYRDAEKRFGQQPGAIYELIEELYDQPVWEIRQEILAACLNQDEADALAAEPGAPALRIVRRYLGGGGQPFEVSVSVHPADRFTYSMHIRRDGG